MFTFKINILGLIKMAVIFQCCSNFVCENVCYKDKCQDKISSFRYLFYDVNPPEGFNLRRDVYMRFAILAHKMQQSKDPKLNRFKLILPPWSHLMHWTYSEAPEYIPWSLFFDLKSLQLFAPVMEMHEYFSSLVKEKYTKVQIDEVYVLQHFKDMFESGNFENRWNIEKCQKPIKLRYFYYTNITSNNVRCLSYHGPATELTLLLSQSKAKSMLLDHAEVPLHDTFGSKTYWEARRSMRFNTELRDIASEFRNNFLNSSDTADNTKSEPDWRNDKYKRNAKGGPYLAVHLRRRDFVKGRPNETPDLESVVEQITQIMKKQKLNKVFIATDAPSYEFEELKGNLTPAYEVYKYIPTQAVQDKFREGGIAIIDQIICSHAQYFIGTSESTFSFRIQEEREILGFSTHTTFNSLCKAKNNCKKPSIWKIVY